MYQGIATFKNGLYFGKKPVVFYQKKGRLAVDPLYLKEFRKKKKLNQKDFAKMVGVSQQMISAYELGKKTLSLEKYREIKAAFGYQDCDSSRLRFMIDYLRLTFKSVRDLEHFTKTFLLCPFKEFTWFMLLPI